MFVSSIPYVRCTKKMNRKCLHIQLRVNVIECKRRDRKAHFWAASVIWERTHLDSSCIQWRKRRYNAIDIMQKWLRMSFGFANNSIWAVNQCLKFIWTEDINCNLCHCHKKNPEIRACCRFYSASDICAEEVMLVAIVCRARFEVRTAFSNMFSSHHGITNSWQTCKLLHAISCNASWYLKKTR